MATSVAALKAAITAGTDIINGLSGVYDAAMKFYGKFEGATEFENRYRSLELAIVNASDHDLEYDSAYFSSGTWFTSPLPLVIKPGEVCMGFVANR